MQNKPMDQVYCGVDPRKIQKAHPILKKSSFRHLLVFIRDRYTVHVNKDICRLRKPWTDNKVLQQYRFTNVRREHDKQSKMYITGVTSRLEMSLKEKMLNAFLFRSWNNYRTLSLFGGPFMFEEILSGSAKEHARKVYDRVTHADPNHMWYNSAYIQGNTKAVWRLPDGKGLLKSADQSDSEDCIPLRMFNIGKYVIEHGILDDILECESQDEVYLMIRRVPGFSSFLAYQVFVDLTYIPEFPFSENEFVVAGPGCKAGIDHIFTDRDGMSYEEALFWLRDNFDRLNSKFPDVGLNLDKLMIDLPKHDRCMNVMSLENCMCELSKYLKVVNGTGRPRCRYKGC